MLEAVVIVYIVRTLDVGLATLGIVFSVGGFGFVVGPLLPPVTIRRLCLGVTTALALAVIGASDLLVPLAEGSGWLVVPLLPNLLANVGMVVLGLSIGE